MLTKKMLCKHLSEDRSGEIICLDSAPSTNTIAGFLAQEHNTDGTVVIANSQTKGSGRLGRSFYSPGAVGIYFSYIKVLPKNTKNLGLLTSFAGLAVSDAVSTVCGIQPGIKWPNDILIDGKKICGILTKLKTDPKTNTITQAIIGVGVNVNQTEGEFPPDLAQKAGSLRMALGKPVDRARLCSEIIVQMDKLLFDEDALCGDATAYVERLSELSCTIGKSVTVATPDGEETATAIAIAPDGGLVVKTPTGTRVIRSGEIDDNY
ncbi:MAG: biotin--[acetyl-CoA-carboxylase] ligase [Clostridiales bacterium]|nr:biotin--[acetyl-CoA-carboxylase] ligase [Clostridiales bacterium]